MQRFPAFLLSQLNTGTPNGWARLNLTPLQNGETNPFFFFFFCRHRNHRRCVRLTPQAITAWSWHSIDSSWRFWSYHNIRDSKDRSLIAFYGGREDPLVIVKRSAPIASREKVSSNGKEKRTLWKCPSGKHPSVSAQISNSCSQKELAQFVLLYWVDNFCSHLLSTSSPNIDWK